MRGETVTARVTRRLSLPPEQVFRAWLEPDSARRWMERALQRMGLAGDVRRVEIDARVGGRFMFSDMRDGAEARAWGGYRVIDAPSRLQFTWFATEEDEREDSSLVTIGIEPAAGGSAVTLEHEMPSKWVDYLERTEGSWAAMLDAIEETASGG